jgi:8-oxo-dGTP pyrophosphatase MutT (NUDIX family)
MHRHKVLDRTEKKVGFFNIEELKVEHPTEEGKEKIYGITKHHDWVNVIAETSDNNIVLVEQWRAGIDEMSIEVPGGKIDEGETPIEAGLRELKEETGYSVCGESKILYLGEVLANPAIQNNKMHFVYVNNITKKHDTNFDEFELVYTHVYHRAKVIEMLSNGQIQHAYSVLGLYKTFKG